MKMKVIHILTMLFAMSTSLSAQKTDRLITFPDIPGYQTLKCDFHIHTVFSDGSVWPNIRIDEAVRDGLDAISLTEHLEYQPHGDDLPHPDRNRSYYIAQENAKAHDLLVIHGVEITRDLPPGHANAIFIEDANKLLIDDPVEAYREAGRQGAFVFWNHPNWISQQRNGVATLTDMHRMLIEEDLLHGIEVVNDITYSDEALQIAIDEDLTVMGTSDIHGLVDWQFEISQGGHRPISLVFAEEKSEESIREAMFDHRTVAWFNNRLIGSEEFLVPLIKASIHVEKATYQGPSSVVTVLLSKESDANFLLQNTGEWLFHSDTDVIMLDAQSTTEVEVKTGEQRASFDLQFEVLNATTAPNVHPGVTIPVKVDL